MEHRQATHANATMKDLRKTRYFLILVVAFIAAVNLPETGSGQINESELPYFFKHPRYRKYRNDYRDEARRYFESRINKFEQGSEERKQYELLIGRLRKRDESLHAPPPLDYSRSELGDLGLLSVGGRPIPYFKVFQILNDERALMKFSFDHEAEDRDWQGPFVWESRRGSAWVDSPIRNGAILSGIITFKRIDNYIYENTYEEVRTVPRFENLSAIKWAEMVENTWIELAKKPDLIAGGPAAGNNMGNPLGGKANNPPPVNRAANPFAGKPNANPAAATPMAPAAEQQVFDTRPNTGMLLEQGIPNDPSLLQGNRLTGIAGSAERIGVGIQDQQAIVGLAWGESKGRRMILPVYQDDKRFQNEVRGEAGYFVSGVNVGFDADGKVNGIQAVFAKATDGKLDLNDIKYSDWLGQATRKSLAKKVNSNGEAVFGITLQLRGLDIKGVGLIID